MRDLLILGSGGLAQEYAWLAEEINEDRKSFNLIGFLDDDPGRIGNEYIGYPVLGPIGDATRYKNATLAVGVGDPRLRASIVERIHTTGIVWASLISPSVRIHASNRLGAGVMIGRLADVTVGCTIGAFVMINIHAVLGHAVQVGDFSVISPNVTINGEAVIGRLCYIGANAFVRNVSVGDRATIGASSAVVKDVPEDSVVAGVPAKILHSGAPVHKLTRSPG